MAQVRNHPIGVVGNGSEWKSWAVVIVGILLTVFSLVMAVTATPGDAGVWYVSVFGVASATVYGLYCALWYRKRRSKG